MTPLLFIKREHTQKYGLTPLRKEAMQWTVCNAPKSMTPVNPRETSLPYNYFKGKRWLNLQLDICTNINICINVYTHRYICIYIYIYTYILINIYIYVYIQVYFQIYEYI